MTAAPPAPAATLPAAPFIRPAPHGRRALRAAHARRFAALLALLAALPGHAVEPIPPPADAPPPVGEVPPARRTAPERNEMPNEALDAARTVGTPAAGEADATRWLPLLYGGVGVFVDDRPFYGRRAAFVGSGPTLSPIARPNGAERRASVLEFALEPGIGFEHPLTPAAAGAARWSLFGAASIAISGTQGADVYRRDSHVEVAPEKAFVGLLRRPATAGDPGPRVIVRAGRLGYTLDDGFLVHHVRGSSNAGARRALNLGARSAADFVADADWRQGAWRLQAFVVDPDELPVVDSRSRFGGGQASWAAAPGLDLAAAHVAVLRSDARLRRPNGSNLPREGLHATTLQARWRNAFGQDGLLLAGLVGEQRHRDADVRARAGYVRAAWRWNALPGRPALEWRHARFSGDRPDTARFERWDPLLAAGSDEWMGGIAFSKFQPNSNLVQDRLRAFWAPAEGLALTLDWLRYRADEANATGVGPLTGRWADRALGDEWMAIARWSVGPGLYAQGVASVNRPGPGIRQALAAADATAPSPRRWLTLQASLYWFWP